MEEINDVGFKQLQKFCVILNIINVNNINNQQFSTSRKYCMYVEDTIKYIHT